MKAFNLILPICASPGFCSPTWWDQDGLTVSTSSGTVHGRIDASAPDVRQFLGVPFAQPPLGDLRFAPPQPLNSSATAGFVEATQLPPSCMQFLGTGPSVYTREILEFNLQGLNTTGSISEDCLTLAVWAPKAVDKSKPLPVLIYVYGGGFSTGGIDVPYQIPTQLVQSSQDVIVVSFNYRLNIFGYPNAAGIGPTSQNVGLLDQRAAVEWTQANIASFGGDPDRMVLWGQSAGASSVEYYVYAYYDDPIISGFVSDSGTAVDATGVPPTTNFTFVASQLGCADLSPDDELSCMRGLPASAIENFLANYSNTQAQPPLGFRPVPDNVTVPFSLTDRARTGKIPSIPGIIGTNAQDGVPFATYNPDGPNTTAAELARLSSFFCPSTYQIQLRQQAGLGEQTFSYFYGGNFSNIAPKPWMGAYHSGELPLIFGTDGDFRGPSTDFEEQTSRAMQKAYVAFAAGGAEGLRATGWMPYTKLGEDVVRNFGNATTGEAVGDIAMSWSEGRCAGSKVRA
jgi:carboxylesterase type B